MKGFRDFEKMQDVFLPDVLTIEKLEQYLLEAFKNHPKEREVILDYGCKEYLKLRTFRYSSSPCDKCHLHKTCFGHLSALEIRKMIGYLDTDFKLLTNNQMKLPNSYFKDNNSVFVYIGYESQEPTQDQPLTQLVKDEDSGKILFSGKYQYTGNKSWIGTDQNGYDIYEYYTYRCD